MQVNEMDISVLMSSDEYKTIEADIESFVKEKLDGYKPSRTTGKTIHDPVWGSVEYSDWEMQLIDSPLFQRLRDIHQVGLAMLTYPAARHSRFEHSLGVAAAAKKMCEKISKNSKRCPFKKNDKNKVYLAALLHDIGHGFYSHLSESIYGEFKAFDKLITKFKRMLKRKPKAHEALAFIIINTETFRNFFFENINYPDKNECQGYLFSDVGKMIIGANIEESDEVYSFLTAIINGPFDADKLDYIKRDSHTAGLSLSYDMERLFTKIVVHTVQNESRQTEYRLVIKFNGVTAIEELTFCRIMLFSYIYYHQKVLISEAMVKDYVHGLHRLGIIREFSDFLRYTDSDILKLAKQQGNKSPFPKYEMLNLEKLALNIANRRLPKRCFEISQSNVENIAEEPKFDLTHQCQILAEQCKNGITAEELQSRIELMIFSLRNQETREDKVLLDSLYNELGKVTFEAMLALRKKFYIQLANEYSKAGKAVNFNMFDVYIIVPKSANYGEAGDSVILGRNNKDLLQINDFVKLDDWAASFNSNKWRGYVFVSEHIDLSIAFKVAQKFILKGKARVKKPTSYMKVDL